ncbi:MAG: hypothetical protein ACYDCM_07300 [Candidatus Acidiferrales bacterium]
MTDLTSQQKAIASAAATIYAATISAPSDLGTESDENIKTAVELAIKIVNAAAAVKTDAPGR